VRDHDGSKKGEEKTEDHDRGAMYS
jgi:hypothetical protein